MSSDPLPDFAHEWMQQWRSAERELPKVRDRELRSLSTADAVRTASILNLPRVEDGYSNGLVIQQRWFMRLQLLELHRHTNTNNPLDERLEKEV
jgi:hypothetical protein